MVTANTATVGIIDESRKLLADGRCHNLHVLDVNGVSTPVQDVKGRFGGKVVRVVRYGGEESRYKVVYPETSYRLLDETFDGVRRVLATHVSVVFETFPEAPTREAAVLAVLSYTSIEYASAPGADVCVYCGFNNNKDGSSLRQGLDCGYCGGN